MIRFTTQGQWSDWIPESRNSPRFQMARYISLSTALTQASENWQRQKRKIRCLHSHMANIRRDYLHKVTSEISKNHAMIVI
ncbi:hypothetical protein EPW57_22355 [Salmonella enterica]|nr:hypothetical protein [Salmonella enterica]